MGIGNYLKYLERHGIRPYTSLFERASLLDVICTAKTVAYLPEEDPEWISGRGPMDLRKELLHHLDEWYHIEWRLCLDCVKWGQECRRERCRIAHRSFLCATS